MVRRLDPGEKKAFHPLYWIFVIAVVFFWIWAFKLYFERYEYLHPEITWATPGIYYDMVKIDGVLLWKEVPVRAPADGQVSYPQGTEPVRVARGSVIARIKTGGGLSEVKAYQQGYFVAGTDGDETSWRYSALWPGSGGFPQNKPFRYMKDGESVAKGGTIGKLIEQPQELRFIGYAKMSDALARQVRLKRLKVKMDGDDTVSPAEIRVYDNVGGGRTKFYLTLPWFPSKLVTSRRYRLTIEAGSTEGALVPDSALLEKGGKRGVYVVKGSRVVFSEVEGRHIEGDKFLAISGVSVGDAVVEDASSAREGRIQLW